MQTYKYYSSILLKGTVGDFQVSFDILLFVTNLAFVYGNAFNQIDISDKKANCV